MPKSFLRYVATLVLLVVAFGLYTAIAVPWIERPALIARERPGETHPYQPPAARFQPLLGLIFPEGSWERSNVRVFKTNDLLLVFGTHESIRGGGLRVQPISVALCDQGLGTLTSPATAKSSEARIWIVRAPGGALLQFDSEVNLERGGIGKLQSAKILGKVTVTGTQPAHPNEEPIEILAENLQFDGKRLWSNEEVHLRWGASQATGRDLTIVFADAPPKDSDRLPGTRQTAIETFGLSRLDRFHLRIPEHLLPKGTPGIQGTLADPSPSGSPPQSVTSVPRGTNDFRLDAGSSGPFLIDFTRGFAELRDQVWMTHPRADGIVDDLRCDRLNVAFAEKAKTTKSDDENKVGMLSMSQVPTVQLQRISILGQPATLSSTATITEKNRQQQQQQLLVDPTKVSVPLQHAGKWPFHSISLEIGELRHDIEGTEGLRITGQGIVRWTMASAKEAVGELYWKKGMVWHRLQKEEIVILEGDVTGHDPQFGSLTAQMLRASFEYATTGMDGRESTLAPKSISAKDNVRIESKGLEATTNQLDIDFRRLNDPNFGPHVATGNSAELALGDARGNGAPRKGTLGSDATATLKVFGERIQAHLVQHKGRLKSTDSRWKEKSARPESPFKPRREAEWSLRRRSVRANNLTSGTGEMILRGAPARVRAHRLDLVGGTIRLDQASNHCWMEGPGTATLPLPASMAQRIPEHAAVATVSWRQGLDFDGQILRCQEDVTVRGPTQLLRCPTLALVLDRAIPFQTAPTNLEGCALAETTASGGVFIENRSVDERGLRSIDQAELRSLTIFHAEGKLEGEGPGWLKSVSLGTQPLPGQSPRPNAPSAGLTLLQVQFDGDLRGNLKNRFVRIGRGVRGIYSPVSDWSDRVDPPGFFNPDIGGRGNAPNSTPANGIPPEALLLRCEELQAAQSGPQVAGGPSGFELAALGNTIVEGATFSAQANRLSFEKGKDLLVLEGTDRTHAKIIYQDPKGGRKLDSSGRKLEYWTKTGQVKGSDIGFLEFTTTGKSP